MRGWSFVSRIAALAFALMVGALVAIAGTLWKLRDDTLDQARANAGSLATVLARQTSFAAAAMDLVLDETLSRLNAIGAASPEALSRRASQREVHEFLAARLAKLPQADVINIVNARGLVVASSRDFPTRAIDLSDRDHFLHFANERDKSTFVGEPVFSKFGGAWSMFFARRIEGPTGEFLGEVVIGARPANFMRLYDAIGDIDGATFMLLRRDGSIFLRHPDPTERAGERLPRDVGWYKAVEQGGGYYRSPGLFDNESRWIAVRPLDRFPLVVNVALSEVKALGVWRARAIVIVLGSLGFVAVLAILIWLLMDGYRKIRASRRELIEREARLAATSSELSQTNLRFHMALTHMRQGLAMFDANDRIVIHNRGYAELYGLSSDQMPPGTPLREILDMRVANGMHTIDGPDAYVRRHREHLGDDGVEMEQLRDGRHIVLTHCNMPDGGWITTHEDVTDRQRAIARIAHMAHHDALTNLANRTLFIECLEKLARDAIAGQRYAVLLIDLDQFKAINDTHGHSAGDALLWAVAARMQQTVEPGRTIARLGGDEFAIAARLAPGDDPGVIRRLADRLLDIIREPYLIEDRELKVGVSIGIALSNEQTTDAGDIMRFADLALYRAKAEGKNCHRFFEPEMEEKIRLRRELARELDKALGLGALDVHYQPVVDAATREVRGMEALARWRHPTLGTVSPADFISIAEEAGHVVRLGDFVLERACHDALGWPADVKVAVNVSPIQIAACDFVEKARRVLARSGLPACRLELEITESVMLVDNDHNLAVLRELQDLGVSIVLDDFGTGYSSLSYLNSFAFDKIKIDKSFIDGLGVEAGASAIVSATTSIARAFEAVTTAEGVETEAQATLLRAAAVSQLQGYLFGKPLPACDWVFVDGAARPRDIASASRAA